MVRGKTPERRRTVAARKEEDADLVGGEANDARDRPEGGHRCWHKGSHKREQKRDKKRQCWRLLIRIMIASWFFASSMRMFNIEGDGQWAAWLSFQKRYVCGGCDGLRRCARACVPTCNTDPVLLAAASFDSSCKPLSPLLCLFPHDSCLSFLFDPKLHCSPRVGGSRGDRCAPSCETLPVSHSKTLQLTHVLFQHSISSLNSDPSTKLAWFGLWFRLSPRFWGRSWCALSRRLLPGCWGHRVFHNALRRHGLAGLRIIQPAPMLLFDL